jgi:hypothetical protein
MIDLCNTKSIQDAYVAAGREARTVLRPNDAVFKFLDMALMRFFHESMPTGVDRDKAVDQAVAIKLIKDELYSPHDPYGGKAESQE